MREAKQSVDGRGMSGEGAVRVNHERKVSHNLSNLMDPVSKGRRKGRRNSGGERRAQVEDFAVDSFCTRASVRGENKALGDACGRKNLGVRNSNSGAGSNGPVEKRDEGLMPEVCVVFVFPSAYGEYRIFIRGPAKNFKCSFEIGFDDGGNLSLPNVVS